MKNQKGFTLIELIVVIAIIAILAAIVMINVVQYINKSKTSSVQADLAAMQTTGMAYFSDPANSAVTGATWLGTQTIGTNPVSVGLLANQSGATAIASECNASGTGSSAVWCCDIPTVTSPGGAANNDWCIDSTGYSGNVVSGKCPTTTGCP